MNKSESSQKESSQKRGINQKLSRESAAHDGQALIASGHLLHGNGLYLCRVFGVWHQRQNDLRQSLARCLDGVGVVPGGNLFPSAIECRPCNLEFIWTKRRVVDHYAGFHQNPLVKWSAPRRTTQAAML
jgi:hypothetical protein